MTEDTPTVRRLRDLPAPERRGALEDLVVGEFKATLLMSETEELPLDESYFELGFTSLLIDEVKQRLENLLGRPVNTTLLFNSPTVERLMTHLTGEVLADVFGTDPVAAPARTPANDAANDDAANDDGALVDDLLSDLYRS